MPISDSPNRYGAIARWLHWTMFTLIAVQIVGGIFLEDLPKGSALRLSLIHISEPTRPY